MAEHIFNRGARAGAGNPPPDGPVIGEEAASRSRWQHLVHAAFLLEERAAAGEGRAALDLIDSALEVFTSETDPIEDFDGYAVRRLLIALRTALSPAQDQRDG